MSDRELIAPRSGGRRATRAPPATAGDGAAARVPEAPPIRRQGLSRVPAAGCRWWQI